MGKASKWIVNFLLGRKEDREKKRDITFYEEKSNKVRIPSPRVPSTPPTYKRRWSFGRSSSKESSNRAHRSSKSLDLITITPLLTHAVSSSLELENHPRRRTKPLADSSYPSSRDITKPIDSSHLIRQVVEYAAATRIQAALRSHLARKALHALKGLVKLQALVRGYLVRKQTSATIRSMHALMSIQVRARFQRVQMADESRRAVRSHSSRHQLSSQVNGLGVTKKDGTNVDPPSSSTAFGTNDYLGHLQIGRVDHSASRRYKSEELKHENAIHFSSTHNSPVNPLTHKSPNTVPGRASFTCKQPDYMRPVAPPSPPQPSYMTNTESSKAKARSHSEPRQRPQRMKQIRNSAVSQDEIDLEQEAQTQHPSPEPVIDQEPWFAKIYQNDRASNSNHINFLVTYGPHINLY